MQANPTRNPEAVEQSDGGISTDLLAMGCKSSAAIFQRAMDQVLAHFSSTNTFRVRRGGYERPMVSLSVAQQVSTYIQRQSYGHKDQ